jgi:hypothetical protein
MGNFPNRPPFSWSKSRNELFEKCQRAYWYQYYGYWNGWKLSTPGIARKAYFLRNLTPLDAIVGVVAHSVAKDFLMQYKNTGEIESLPIVLDNAKKAWDKIVVENTFSKKYRNTKNTLAIQEFNYGELTEVMLVEAEQKMNSCVENLYAYLIDLNLVTEQIKFIDDVDIGFVEADYGGLKVKIYAVIDLAYVDAYDDFIIVDWKTGTGIEEIDTRTQLLCYGLWANDVMSIPFNKIKYKIVRLDVGEELNYVYEEKQYQEILQKINNSIKTMLELDSTWQQESRFYLTNDLELCKKCKFKEICPKMNRNMAMDINFAQQYGEKNG